MFIWKSHVLYFKSMTTFMDAPWLWVHYVTYFICLIRTSIAGKGFRVLPVDILDTFWRHSECLMNVVCCLRIEHFQNFTFAKCDEKSKSVQIIECMASKPQTQNYRRFTIVVKKWLIFHVPLIPANRIFININWFQKW